MAGSTAYDPSTRTATFTPAAVLAKNTTYTATISATSVGGDLVTKGGSWSFTTVKPDTPVGTCPCSLYQDSST
ncbi:Ig-like domain-containing protein, partial [Specibacter cremeus]|uniref:Ig-like domain-containing protein n=1 Tax=Specibacter cremeus TaxID=1629051 RepID=UPI0030B80D83